MKNKSLLAALLFAGVLSLGATSLQAPVENETDELVALTIDNLHLQINRDIVLAMLLNKMGDDIVNENFENANQYYLLAAAFRGEQNGLEIAQKVIKDYRTAQIRANDLQPLNRQ